MTRHSSRMHGLVFRVRRASFLVLSIPSGGVDLSCLTAAQREVAAGVLAGRSNAEIARQLRRSARTVANHLAAIYRKLGVESRCDLAARVAITDLRR